MPQLLTFFLVFLAVLALVGVGWLATRYSRNRVGSSANRGRMPRLAVIDATTVDTRRKLVLVRRDNVEHLLMIGGPSDLVVESNIVRAIPQRDPLAPRGPVGAELPPRVAPLPDATNWDPNFDAPEPNEPAPLPELPPRQPRPSFAEEVRRSSPAIAERRSGNDPLASLVPPELPRADVPPPPPPPPPRPRTPPRGSEPLIPRSEPMIPRSEAPIPRSEAVLPRSESIVPRSESILPRGEPAMPRSEPVMPRPAAPPIEPIAKAPPPRPVERPVPPPPPAPPASALSAADQNLAEMAQRLEAALRKPAGEPALADRAPPVAPEPPSRPVPRAPAEIAVNPPPARNDSVAPLVAPPAPKPSAFENLEDEMASLLGRPKTPS